MSGRGIKFSQSSQQKCHKKDIGYFKHILLIPATIAIRLDLSLTSYQLELVSKHLQC